MSHPFESHFGPYLRLNAWQDTPCVTHNCLWHHAITNTKMYAATYIDVRCFFMLFKQDVIICSSIKHTIFQEIPWQIYIFLCIFSNIHKLFWTPHYMHRLFVSNRKTGIVQNYLWADLVATLSNLQMYNFAHDDQATVHRTAVRVR